MNKEEFISEVEKLSINVTEDKLNKLNRYYELLVEWNEKINLTAITEESEVYLKHFYDSLTLIKAYDLNKNIKVLDVGTGAGLPGIVLKIFFDNIDITLVDALNKRINFINIVIKELELKNINAIHARAEDFAKKHLEEFDLVTSRAVARLNILNELCIPTLKVGGYFIPMKANIDEELKESKKSIDVLNSKLENIISFNLPIENSIRNLVIIKKMDKTNNKYPRRYDLIKKKPL